MKILLLIYGFITCLCGIIMTTVMNSVSIRGDVDDLTISKLKSPRTIFLLSACPIIHIFVLMFFLFLIYVKKIGQSNGLKEVKYSKIDDVETTTFHFEFDLNNKHHMQARDKLYKKCLERNLSFGMYDDGRFYYTVPE